MHLLTNRVHATARTVKRRVAVAVTLGLVLGSAQSSRAQTFPSGCIGYCGNGVAIGIGAVAGGLAAVGILLAVNHDHHFLRGCVSNGPNGPQLLTSDSKTWFLKADPSTIKAGEELKFHGSRMKKTKDSGDARYFQVDKLKKDYGPCHAPPAPAAP